MSQQTRRLTAQAGLVDDMPSVYATADPQMFNEIFNFQTGVELLGIPAAAKDNNNNNNNSNPNWRVSHGHHHQQYENMAASGGGGGGAVQFNSLKETNMNSMQGIHNMDAMQLISGHAHSAIAFPSNVIDHPEFNSHKNYAEISCQFPGFSMGNQSLCSGGINELLLLPSGNGNLQNNTQFAPQQQQHHLSSTVNWDNRQMGSVHPSTSQWTEQALETKIGDDRSVQGLSLSLSSNSQVQVQSFETTRLISSQDYKSKSGHDVFNGSKVGFFTPFSRSEGSKGLWNPNNQMNSGSSGLFAGYMKQSKYMKPTKQLLDEFCNVAAKGVKNVNSSSVPKQEQQKSSFGGHNTIGSIAQTERKLGGSSVTISSTPTAAAAATGICNESGNGKDQINFSGDRFELRRRKAKLLWMLDEVDRRYRHYCEQMKVVVTSFESAAGAGAASTYTCLASKAMSRHFRCLKDAIGSQIKATNDALGEKESSVPGITKGETPRLKLIEQSLRQQRAFQQVGMLEQDAWRPQRGLPERAVTVLRAWLFEHFLHPYPSDADKHLLARQTGLSRSQVSNWFINARVRLWKPMVEEMYQEEAREAEMKEKDTIPDPNTHEKHEGASDSNKSSEEFKQMTAPDSTGCMSLPMESQDEMFDCSFRGGGGEQLMSFSRNANNTSARKSEASELIGEHSDIKVHGSEVGNIDFSCYNGNGSNNSNNGIFHQPTYFGNGDVSLTLGLRHTGALSVPVADQEKYHSALYLP